MNYQVNRHKSTISKCFVELQASFTLEQSFEIIIVLITVEWIKNNKKFFGKGKVALDAINSKEITEYNFVEILKREISLFEENNPLFEQILTSLIENVINYPDININRKFFSVYKVLNNARFSHEEIKEIILMILSSEFEFNRFNDTPDSIVKLIEEIIELRSVNDMAVFCCGYSKIALRLIEDYRTRDIKHRINYYGEEIVLSTSLISKLLMIIFEVDDAIIENKDVLSFYSNSEEVVKYDLVITDIPLVTNPEESFLRRDPRLKFGIPTKNSSEWYFGQNVIYQLNDKGIGILIGTKGTLVRGNETDLRKKIIEEDLVECVVTLPNNLYEKSTLGTEMIILNRDKPETRKGKILFINASEYGMKLNRLQHSVSNEGIKEISRCYKEGIEKEYFSKFVDIVKIRQFKYKMNPAEYLDFDSLKDTLSETIQLKEIAQVIRGLNIKKETITDSNDESLYCCLNIKDIEEGRINYEQASRFKSIENGWIEKYEIKPNDIIVTAKGWSFKFAIVDDDYKYSLISSNLTIIRVNLEKYNPYVLMEFFQSELGARMIDSLQTGTTVKVLNNSQLEKFEIPIFDIDNMNIIGEKIKNARIKYENSIQNAKRMFEGSKHEYTELLSEFIIKI